MPILKVKNIEAKDVGEVELSDDVFGVEVKHHLLHEIVRMQRSRKRSGTACTKERNAVAGGGAKPYRQKGTGRARQGSRRAPNHVGGGTVFGPRPRSYDFSPPKKVRRGAMRSALSLLVQREKVIVVDGFELKEIKTRALAKVLRVLGAERALVVDSRDNEKLRRSANNLADSHFLPPEGVNVLDLLRHDELVISRDAVLELQGRLMGRVRERKVG